MRPSLMGSVLILSVLAAGVPVSSCPAGQGPGRPAGQAARSDNPTWEVEGVGKTQTDAEQSALEKGRDKVVEYLAQQYGETRWTPAPGDLQQLKMTRLLEKKEVHLDRSGDVIEVRLAVELTQDALKKMLQQAREQRMGERQRLAARGLAVLVVVLLLVAAYLRLEEATKGYYTALLRLSVLVLLGLTGLCLWWLG